MKKRRILLIGYNFFPEPTGIGKYSGEMISWFVDRGYDCTVITSYPYYPFWKVQEPYYKRRFWFTREIIEGQSVSQGSLTLLRCPQYVPSNPTGAKRMLLELSFLTSATFALIGLLFKKKHDFVITVAPSFQIGLLGALYKKIRKSKLFYHIQDLQIEAARDLGLIRSKRLIQVLFAIERYIFRQSDIVSSISDGMVSRIKEKAKKDVVLFPNWTDINQFYPIDDMVEIRSSYGYHPSDKIILYSGSIGEKQGLESIVVAANDLRHRQEIKFIICGTGPYKKELQRLSESLQLKNIEFLPIQPFEKFNQFLNLADLHLIIQKSSASDLVMPSKLTTILSVGGVSIITANAGSGLYSLLQAHQIGILAAAEDQAALNSAILSALESDTREINKNAREYAENYLSIENIMTSFELIMCNLQNNKFELEGAETSSNEMNNRPEVRISSETNGG